ncbi:zinc finger protein Gfi-1b-like [Littorina saxatilis]|uniref:C2H2-type domain-containing protein n=1 Tax=Littorina saxatilis TaxID=31220 RepID=A0AAN9FZV6_9CAEN
MDGVTSLLHGPVRPIPQRPAPGDALFYPLPPAVAMDLRLAWKAPAAGGCDKLYPAALTPFHSLPHSLALFQQLRRQHGLLTSDRLSPDPDVPKTPLHFTIASPLIGHPAPTALHSILPLPGVEATGRGDENLVGGVARGSPGLPPLALSDCPRPGTSPYGRKLFPCSQCRYTTDRRNNLKRHMLTMHQLSAKLLECCGVLFRTKAALREHALIFHYHGYTCFYCGRRFCRKALLKRHLSVHNGQKEFICNVCDYATSHKSNLERHRRVHMRQDDEGEVDAHDYAGALSDVKSNVSESNSNISCDELSVCSDDDDEEINVHSD